MANPKLSPVAVDWLVLSMVHVAWIDGKVSPVEVALIERVMKTFDWPEPDVKRVRWMLDGREPKPDLKLPPPSMDYAGKLEVFREMCELVFADGVLDKREQDLVMKVANALGLHLSDMQTIWTRAKRHAES